jgi:hypothetical protein
MGVSGVKVAVGVVVPPEPSLPPPQEGRAVTVSARMTAITSRWAERRIGIGISYGQERA